MLNSFDILRTKISFLVVKVMGALPDAEAGWVQAFPCCFGAWSVEVPCRGPAYVSWGYLENVICIRNDIIRFLCIFGPKLARVSLLFFIPFQLLHWYFNRLTWRFFPSHTFLAFEGHLSQKIKKTYKWSNFLFVLAKKWLFCYNLSYHHLKFWIFWILKNFVPLLAKFLALTFMEGSKDLAYNFECYFWAKNWILVLI